MTKCQNIGDDFDQCKISVQVFFLYTEAVLYLPRDSFGNLVPMNVFLLISYKLLISVVTVVPPPQ